MEREIIRRKTTQKPERESERKRTLDYPQNGTGSLEHTIGRISNVLGLTKEDGILPIKRLSLIRHNDLENTIKAYSKILRREFISEKYPDERNEKVARYADYFDRIRNEGRLGAELSEAGPVHPLSDVRRLFENSNNLLKFKAEWVK